jgi:CBS domain-containing protein
MARYRSDYGRDFGRWREQGPYIGGMRSDGWGGTGDWRRFPGEEGWYGEGYEGMPGIGYDANYGLGDVGWGRMGGLRYGRRPAFENRYEQDFGPYDRGYGWGGQDYGRREPGYSPGWEDSPRSRPGWSRTEDSWGGPSIRALDIMTGNPRVVLPDASITEVARLMRDLDVGIIPVVDSEESMQLRGVVTDRDIVTRCLADAKDSDVRVNDCMTADVRTVNQNDDVREVMRLMRQAQVRRVPVTDRNGRLVGIIAQADLAVDYASHDYEREAEVAETLERISEPAEPRRQAMYAGGEGRGDFGG